MSQRRTKIVKDGSETTQKLAKPPACLAIASKGVQTGSDFAALMSATITDLITGAITPQVGNAVCNAGGKLLKIVEMQHRYGGPGGRVKNDLQLVSR